MTVASNEAPVFRAGCVQAAKVNSMSCYRPVTGYRLLLVLCVALLLGLLPIFLFSKPTYSVGTLTSGFTQTTFAGGRPSPLTNTTAMDLAPDGRLLVA